MPARRPARLAVQAAGPPEAPRVASERRLHGTVETDFYAWMRDHDSPAMRRYLEAERAFYDQEVRGLAPLAARIAEEARARVPEGTDDSVSWQLGGFTYWTRTPAGSDHSQLVRHAADGVERVLLDEELLAAETGFAEVGVREPSPDGSLLAWSVDRSGAERYELRIRDLSSGEDLPEVIAPTYPGSAWSLDGGHLFYLVPDDTNRPFQVRRHRLGDDPASDATVLEELDARFELTLHLSRSKGFVVVTAASRDTTEVWLIPSDDPLRPPAAVAPRRRAVEYRVDHLRSEGTDPGALYVVTDGAEPEFALVRVAGFPPGPTAWEQVASPACAPVRPDTRLVSCDVFSDRLLLTLRREGGPMLAVCDLDGGAVCEVRPRPPAGTIRVEHAESYDSGEVIVVEESLVEPPVFSALDLRDGSRRELMRKQVPGYQPERYRTERRSAVAADGTEIPVTLAYRVDVPLDGSAPCLLYGYGAYESTSEPEFDVSLPSVLDRGVVYAIAHVRGGGERGRWWWQEGRLRNKPNTFSDFVAVADFLAGDEAGSSPLVDGSRIVSRGLSAGGLLQGAAYSMAPSRWRAVVAEVPFVDCVNSMADPSIPLTVTEWDEWGDPRDPEDYACMRSYAPYENVPKGPRPPLLVTGSLHDPRVLVHEPAKWVARLRHTDSAGSSVLFRAELGAGAHTGPSGRFGHLAYEAEVLAFVLSAMGVSE